MSRENVDLVRSIQADWERGDFSSAEWAHPKIEYVMEDGLTSSSWTGPSGLVEGTRSWMAVWKEMRLEAHEYRELDSERVLALYRFSGRGKTSGVPVDNLRQIGAHLFHVRGGKVVRLVAYFDRKHALSDLGLSEQAMSQENVGVIQALFAAWNSGDMDAVRELYDPHVVVQGLEGWPEPGPFVGREAVMHQWEFQREAFNADTLEAIRDFVDAADRVVVRFIWRGAGQGPETNLEMTGVHMLRKGKIIYQEFFWDHAEALEILELSE